MAARRWHSLPFLCVSFILHASLPLTTMAGSLQRLTAENYENLTKDRSIFIRFVTDWCEECEEMTPDFEKLANDWQDHPIGFVAEVFCDSDDGALLCEEFQVAGYPSFYYGDPESPELYTGKVDYESMAKFAKKNISTQPCSVRNLEVCNDELQSKIYKLRQKKREELEEVEQQILKEVQVEQKKFDEKAIEMQKQYEEMANAFNAKIDRIREESDFKWIQQVLGEMIESEVDDDTENNDEL